MGMLAAVLVFTDVCPTSTGPNGFGCLRLRLTNTVQLSMFWRRLNSIPTNAAKFSVVVFTVH
ncbi:hypothetical protein PF005_g12513 [Phytophthora fragariae]|uniref:Secreted protein n=1 Tax=Phytophthora fragariae TaxID=53985 RepID=A0A6A3ESI5_9STRA|nr:hypothetical protein PF003_g4593 [Phytophthora fragariae]KAE8936355.1 hypothetical protein PF009_g13715 [Phytophthora fragariae]KAE9008253.1 hypothetical protein PF011_g10780 [Phytophthora fragariae]KAE9108141.1 hypothetical protein PF007_g12770 [Phytophthora fragariae]KAE9108669.1 hypothetical protein PF010_g11826 [Phytophthora fragariae]